LSLPRIRWFLANVNKIWDAAMNIKELAKGIISFKPDMNNQVLKVRSISRISPHINAFKSLTEVKRALNRKHKRTRGRLTRSRTSLQNHNPCLVLLSNERSLPRICRARLGLRKRSMMLMSLRDRTMTMVCITISLLSSSTRIHMQTFRWSDAQAALEKQGSSILEFS